MKTMACKHLGGACNKEFHAETFEEIAEISRKHAIEMREKGDEPHIKAMKEMNFLMNQSAAMNRWIEIKRKEFDSLPEDK